MVRDWSRRGLGAALGSNLCWNGAVLAATFNVTGSLGQQEGPGDPERQVLEPQALMAAPCPCGALTGTDFY